ncbi:MAG: flagellinolysin, partial [bacterium]|nr:flagellinolysin [bacterium]
MVITHNMAAMNSSRQLGTVSKKQAKSAEKLGSGYKINRAADDAAGLTISEKMRSQIRGLNQASENAQHGVSLVQIAEGAMAESQDILHRMTELSVKSSNGTNTDEDRNAIQKEIDQLTSELDRISESTEFNTMKLLDGSISKSVNPEAEKKLLEWIKGSWFGDGLSRISSATGWELKNDVNLEVKFEDNGNGTMAAMGCSSGGSNFTLYIYKDALSTDLNYAESGPLSGGMYFDRIMAHEMTHALMGHNNSADINIPNWFVEGVAEAVHGSDDYRFGTNGNSSVDAAYDAIHDFDFSASSPNIDCYSVGMLAVGYLYNQGGKAGTGGAWDQVLAALDNTANTGRSFSEIVNQYYGSTLETIVGQFQAGVESANTAGTLQSWIDNSCGFLIGDSLADSLDNPGQTPAGAVVNSGSQSEITSANEAISDPVTGSAINVTWPNIGENHAMAIHVGASAEQYIEFGIGSMSSAAILGANGIDLSTQEGARSALKVIDGGLDYVSSERSKLGAIQNRLEHTIANLDNVVENTTAAESRIRDVD